MITSSLVHAVKGRIIERLDPEAVILFGSLAKNFQRASDDIELLIVVNDMHPLAAVRLLSRITIALELFRYRSFGLNLLILTENELQQLRKNNEGEWDFVLEVLEEGKVFYERSSKLPA